MMVIRNPLKACAHFDFLVFSSITRFRDLPVPASRLGRGSRARSRKSQKQLMMRRKFILYVTAWGGFFPTNNAFSLGNQSVGYIDPFDLWINRIIFAILLVVLVAGLIKKRVWAKEEDKSVFDVYADKDLQTEHLPEFRFITHETTVQDVINKLGEPSRRRKLPLNSVVGKQVAGAYHVDGMSIPMLEYDLPYQAAVRVMPEYPGKPENRIRAVFYRGPQESADRSP